VCNQSRPQGERRVQPEFWFKHSLEKKKRKDSTSRKTKKKIRRRTNTDKDWFRKAGDQSGLYKKRLPNNTQMVRIGLWEGGGDLLSPPLFGLGQGPAILFERGMIHGKGKSPSISNVAVSYERRRWVKTE